MADSERGDEGAQTGNISVDWSQMTPDQVMAYYQQLLAQANNPVQMGASSRDSGGIAQGLQSIIQRIQAMAQARPDMAGRLVVPPQLAQAAQQYAAAPANTGQGNAYAANQTAGQAQGMNASAPAASGAGASAPKGIQSVADGADPYAAFKEAYKQAIGTDISDDQMKDTNYLSGLSNWLFKQLPHERLVNPDGNTSFPLDRIAQLSNEDLLSFAPELIKKLPEARLMGTGQYNGSGFSKDQLNSLITEPAQRGALGLTGAASPTTTPTTTAPPVGAPPTGGSGGPATPGVTMHAIGSGAGQVGNIGDLTDVEATNYLGNLPNAAPNLNDPTVNAFLNLTGTNTNNANPWLSAEASMVPDAALSAQMALNDQSGMPQAGAKAIGQTAADTLGKGNLSYFTPETGKAWLDSAVANQDTIANKGVVQGAGRQFNAAWLDDPNNVAAATNAAMLSGLSPTLRSARDAVNARMRNQWLQQGNQYTVAPTTKIGSQTAGSQSYAKFLQSQGMF